MSQGKPGRKRTIAPPLPPIRCRSQSISGAWRPPAQESAPVATDIAPAGTDALPDAAATPESPQPPNETPKRRLEPLDYMLEVMNDPQAHPELRARMAVAAARYMCTKVGGEKKGKKEAKAEAAQRVSSRFSAAAPPPRAKPNGSH